MISIRRLLFGLASLAVANLAQSALAQAQECSLQTLDQCKDGNKLSLAEGFREAVWKFFGRTPGLQYDFAANDAIGVFAIPQAPRVDLAGGLKFFDSCAYHACNSKGAVILRPDGKIIAFGILLHHRPDPEPTSGRGREIDYRLVIFVAKDATRDFVVSAITDWGAKKVDEQYVFPGGKKLPLAPVEVRVR